MRMLERQVKSSNKSTTIEERRAAKEYRRQQKNCKTDLEKLEQEAGVSIAELKRTQREISGRHGRRAGQARADRGLTGLVVSIARSTPTVVCNSST